MNIITRTWLSDILGTKTKTIDAQRSSQMIIIPATYEQITQLRSQAIF